MIFSPADCAPSDRYYKQVGEAVRTLAAGAHIADARTELLSLARQYEHLAEFSKKGATARMKVEQLKPDGTERPAPSASLSA
jgi:hypothetical protein